MSLFALNEFEMTLCQSEKLAWKREAEAKCYKHIMEDPELHDARNKKHRKQYAGAKQKKKGKNHRRKLLKPSNTNGEIRSRLGRLSNSQSWQQIWILLPSSPFESLGFDNVLRWVRTFLFVFSDGILFSKECSCRQNEAIRPLVHIQKNISVAVETRRKSARLMEKSCATRAFCSQPVSWDTQYQYET